MKSAVKQQNEKYKKKKRKGKQIKMDDINLCAITLHINKESRTTREIRK